jgi:DNA polymerase
MGEGRPDADIMLVGEAWGETEERSGIPFSGASGQELNRMLQEAGILRNECYVSNVINARPPRNDITAWIPEDKKSITGRMVQRQGKFVDPIVAEGLDMLAKEIALVKPRVIVALGGTALWALTGNESIVKWRGSLLQTNGSVCTIPTYHPAAVLRMWEWRAVAVLDLKRACKELRRGPTPKPAWQFIIRPGLSQVLSTLSFLQSKVVEAPTWIDLDLETKTSHISCCGLSWSKTEAICIPFMIPEDREGYWLLEEEAAILRALYRLLTHPNCWVRGQNLLYDCQYTHRRWGFIPNVKQDTMISQHVLWAGLPKSLAFQASMYAEWYQNWKPDKETWKEGG